MTIRDYGSLKAEIADWLDRTDLDGKMDNFIQLAETEIYRDLRCRENEFVETLDFSADPTSPIPLPENFKQMKLLTVNGTAYEQVTDQSWYARDNTSGRAWDSPRAFSIINRELHVTDWPKSTPSDWGDVQITINYWGTETLFDLACWRVPTNATTCSTPTPGAPITPPTPDDNAHTRLLRVAPNLYLAGGMMFALRYLRELKQEAPWKAEFNQLKAALMHEHRLADLAGSTVTVAGAYGD